MKSFAAVSVLRSRHFVLIASLVFYYILTGLACAQNGARSHLSINIPLLNSGLMAPLQIGIVDDDDRRDERQFAAENNSSLNDVNLRYAATGTLVCSGKIATANLVGAKNIIVTAAHLLRGVHCDAIISPSTCTFATKVGKLTKSSNVKSLIDTGASCPTVLKNANDWAVLKLEADIDGVIPYDVYRGDGAMIESGTNVIAVNAVNSDYFVRGKLFERTKTIANCKSWKIFRPVNIETSILSDCDGGQGSSGGAMLMKNTAVPVLMAIRQGSDETKEQLAQAQKRKSATAGEYREKTWASIYVPVRGDLLKTILNASGE